jgi:hypothetical protein
MNVMKGKGVEKNRPERQDEMRVHDQDARRFKFVNLV